MMSILNNNFIFVSESPNSTNVVFKPLHYCLKYANKGIVSRSTHITMFRSLATCESYALIGITYIFSLTAKL